QAQLGNKQAALSSLGNACDLFFAQTETPPIWVDHQRSNLLINTGMTHLHLGSYKEASAAFDQVLLLSEQDGTEDGKVEALINLAMIEASRDDMPRDMTKGVDFLARGIEGAKAIQSKQWLNEAQIVHAAMRGAWPGEPRVKELQER